MPSVVFDSTVLVSAFLAPRGLAASLLSQARRGAFLLYLSDTILAETRRVLLEDEEIRERYEYPDQRVHDFVDGLRAVVRLVSDPPAVIGHLQRRADDPARGVHRHPQGKGRQESGVSSA